MKHPLEVPVHIGEDDEVKSRSQMVPEIPLTAELLPEFLVDDIG